MSTDNTYNGWTNYETWRVNLEVLDGVNVAELVDAEDLEEAMLGAAKIGKVERYYNLIGDVVFILRGIVEEEVFGKGTGDVSGHMINFADAFVRNVNFNEIARAKIEEAFEHLRYERSRTA